MRNALLAVLFASCPVLTNAPPVSAATKSDPVGDYIVVLDGNQNAQTVASDHTQAHATSVGHVYSHALTGYAARMTKSQAAAVAADDRVRWVQPDGVAKISGQKFPTGINRVDAETSPTARINGVDEPMDVDVAVLDTGVDLDHPDLNVNVGGARNCSDGTSADDGNGHGTHVAGTAAAKDNLHGVVGVAPGARIWPVRVLNNSGFGFFSQIICGIDFVTANADQIEVANMSLGGFGTDDGACGTVNGDAMHQAICASVAAGVTYVVSAGNEHDDAANEIPAAYDEVITVSALADFNGFPGGSGKRTCRPDVDDTIADFSNFGADIDLIAPGTCILSTWKGGLYATISGTSMASPHVAGGAALYKVTNPAASPAQVKSVLQDAGTLNWTWPDGDPDGVQEPLLNVATL
ncbi:S8 family serine peptidase [Nonomuraea turcica]|uniref:S8 family serine peptidase n=1 Tax=Nonomuraea sp. G32 TaxID=3067274 RepID=UPI00273BD905|nr:S8 family serine peptidase [Nonomuraea sp. G32]MDP4510461.1 S8 family serine peptidase [Nonomuraea sp. G32]